MALDCGDGDAGFRAIMERKRIIHARETAMRQRLAPSWLSLNHSLGFNFKSRKWKELRIQKEEEERRLVRDALERRRKERARLAAYMHPGPLVPPDKSSVSQRPSTDFFSVPTPQESLEVAPRNSFLEHDSAGDAIFRGPMQVQRGPLSELGNRQPNENGRPMTRGDLGLKSQKCAAARTQRVTFHPAIMGSKEVSPMESPVSDKLTTRPLKAGDSTARCLSPTIVLDGPDFDSSSNSSFFAQNGDQPVSNVSATTEKHRTSMEDMNTFLEEALRLRLDNEAATTRMIAEVTGLEARLDECGVSSAELRVSTPCGELPPRRSDLDEPSPSATPNVRGIGATASTSITSLGSIPESKVHRSEAWEIRWNDLESTVGESTSELGDRDSKGLPGRCTSKISDKRARFSETLKEGCVSCSPVDSYQGKGEQQVLEPPKARRKYRKTDFLALSEEENNVLASIERLDWKLASAIARCRDSGLCDGRFSTQSAPTVMGQSSIQSRGTSRMSAYLPRIQTSHSSRPLASSSPSRSHRRQNVGLTNKCLDKCLDKKCASYASSLTRNDSDGHMLETATQGEVVAKHQLAKEGVIVFHPDAYSLLNPVGSP